MRGRKSEEIQNVRNSPHFKVDFIFQQGRTWLVSNNNQLIYLAVFTERAILVYHIHGAYGQAKGLGPIT